MNFKRKFKKTISAVLSTAIALSSVPFVGSSVTAAEESDLILRGDFDGDGVTGLDALKIQKFDAKVVELSDIELIIGDTNVNGKTEISDAVNILQYLVGYNYRLSTVGEYMRSNGEEVFETDLGNLNGYAETVYNVEKTGNQKIRFCYINDSSETINAEVRIGNLYGYAECPPTSGEIGETSFVVPVNSLGNNNVSFVDKSRTIQFVSARICPTINRADEYIAEELERPTDPPVTETPATTTVTEIVTTTTTTTTVPETTTTTTTETETETTTTEAPAPVQSRYYALDANIHDAWKEDTNAGFEGSAYINYNNKIGSYIEWEIEAPADGNYEIDFRYSNGSEINRPVKLIVNGDRENGQYVDFKGTGAWTTWDDQTAVVKLRKGKNTIKAYATTSGGGPNMDYIDVSASSKTATVTKATQGKRVEKLNRGVTMAHAKNGNLVSWRLLATDNQETTFKLWRIRDTGNELLGEFTTNDATNYFDKDGTATDSYTIDTYVGEECTEFAQFSLNFPNTNSGQSGAYFDIPTQKPADMKMPDGSTCTYTENDCSVGDVDGDGQYEIFVKWDPSNSQDNSKDGYTGNVYIDCYKLDGKLLWRVDLGKNIRAGAHYTQYMVYDFDGDGKAEMICKTADGTKDGAGNTIGDGSKDYRSKAGRILTGPEYITLFDGQTGKALDTQDYYPERGTVDSWGDGYGNRVDRFTACVAYLDGGEKAYACFGRGYYTRLTMAAWGVNNGKLSRKWTFDTGNNSSAKGYGDGNHHCMAADVNQDGKDEIVCGSAIIGSDGKLYSTTGMAHGDAIHIGDLDPANPGLEIFQCLEDDKHPNGTAVGYGVLLRDAATNKVLFRETAGGDTGRCIADNLITGNGGAEMNGSHSGNVYVATGNHDKVCAWADITKWGQNSLLYWTDVCERAVLDRTMADQYGKGRVFTGDGIEYNNYTKSNMGLTCDLTGDWREEIIARKSDGGLRVFTTTYTSPYNHYTLMHNPQYRVQVASQNNGYNQPPHTDYYIDSTEYLRPEEPDVWTK